MHKLPITPTPLPWIATCLFFLCAGFFLLSPFTAHAQQEDKNSRLLLVLDAVGSPINGKHFSNTLQSYVSEVDVSVKVIEIGGMPATHEHWVSLARNQGNAEKALAVIWFEPLENNIKNFTVFIVFLEWKTGAEIVLPINLDVRRGQEMFRVLAATVRMVLDTDILGDCEEVLEITEKKTIPKPWPAPKYDRKRITTDTYFSYWGDLGISGPSVLNGGRVGVLIRPGGTVGFGPSLGLIGRKPRVAKGIDIKELRIPIRLNLAWFLPLGSTELALAAFWSVEPIWVSAKGIASNAVETSQTSLTKVDTGGGLELRLRIPVTGSFGVFFGLASQAMAVSHSYEHTGDEVIGANHFRLSWDFGFDFLHTGKRR